MRTVVRRRSSAFTKFCNGSGPFEPLNNFWYDATCSGVTDDRSNLGANRSDVDVACDNNYKIAAIDNSPADHDDHDDHH